jgi:hypothetical protein
MKGSSDEPWGISSWSNAFNGYLSWTGGRNLGSIDALCLRGIIEQEVIIAGVLSLRDRWKGACVLRLFAYSSTTCFPGWIYPSLISKILSIKSNTTHIIHLRPDCFPNHVILLSLWDFLWLFPFFFLFFFLNICYYEKSLCAQRAGTVARWQGAQPRVSYDCQCVDIPRHGCL